MSNPFDSYKRTGSRVPTPLLPNAIRWEKARAKLFTAWNQPDEASRATGLAFYYEKRAMQECEDLWTPL
nr:hypothetical protein MedDCM-OCT-S19-C1-cds53 [uncultured Mediterranean phage MEDS2 group]BAR39091.1 hypothetical protein [uncultured Mediterranean phage uvMED]